MADEGESVDKVLPEEMLTNEARASAVKKGNTGSITPEPGDVKPINDSARNEVKEPTVAGTEKQSKTRIIWKVLKAASTRVAEKYEASTGYNTNESGVIKAIPELIASESGEYHRFDEVLFDQIKKYVEDNLEGERRTQALGFLMKLSGNTNIEQLKSNFPDLIPDYLVEFLSHPTEQGKFINNFRNDFESYPGNGLEAYAGIKLLESIAGERILPDLHETPINIRQYDIPMFYHGFPASILESILTEGIDSSREQARKKGLRIDVGSGESAFPMFVSMSRAAWISAYSRYDGSYRGSSAYLKYGAGGGHGNLTAIIDPEFGHSRSFNSSDMEWRQYKCFNDEYQATVDTIPSSAIVGIVCEPKQAEATITALEQLGSKIKLYDIDGNLIWPENIPFEQVQKSFQENYLSPLQDPDFFSTLKLPEKSDKPNIKEALLEQAGKLIDYAGGLGSVEGGFLNRYPEIKKGESQRVEALRHPLAEHCDKLKGIYGSNASAEIEIADDYHFKMKLLSASTFFATQVNPDGSIPVLNHISFVSNLTPESIASSEDIARVYPSETLTQVTEFISYIDEKITHIGSLIEQYKNGHIPKPDEILGGNSITEPILQGGTPEEGLTHEINSICRPIKINIYDARRSPFNNGEKPMSEQDFSFSIKLSNYDLLVRARGVAMEYFSFISDILTEVPEIAEDLAKRDNEKALERYAAAEAEKRDRAIEIAEKLLILFKEYSRYYSGLAETI